MSAEIPIATLCKTDELWRELFGALSAEIPIATLCKGLRPRGVEIGHLGAGLTTVAAPVLVITVLVITVLVITVLVITMLVITVLVITVLVVAVLVVAVLVVAVLVLWVSVSVLAPMPVPQSVPVSVWSGPVGCLLLRTFLGCLAMHLWR
ncbi:MAG: hypothetical protein H6512_08365 [Acidimicrobiia bacterium]|nr:hypothetical protein [Acidimicrobiia bacterium]